MTDGAKTFKPKYYLTASQCNSYFARQFSLLKKGKYGCISPATVKAIKELYGITCSLQKTALPAEEIGEDEDDISADFEAAVAAEESECLLEAIKSANGALDICPGQFCVIPVDQSH